MNTLILFLKGLIIGFGKIIPGVSGALLAITLNVYEQAIDIISHLKQKLFKNIPFLFPLVLGILVSIVLGSGIISYFYNRYFLWTMMLFVGLIIGGIPSVFKNIEKGKIKIRYLVGMIITFILVICLTCLDITGIYTDFSFDLKGIIGIVVIGFLDAATMIIPGISGTAVMLLIGIYESLITVWSTLFDFSHFWFNMAVMIPFSIGLGIGIILISKLMNFLFKKHRNMTNYIIVGFILSSIFILFKQTFIMNYSLFQISIGVVLLIIGIIVSRFMDK